MRSYRATHNLIAVSAGTAETALNTEQSPDLTILAALSDVLNLEPRRENNSEEMTGKEEPDTVYDLGATTSGAFTFEKAQPQHFGLLLAYALGAITTIAAGTGYQHTITPLTGDIDYTRSLPSFTAVQRFGKTVNVRRFASCFVDKVSAKFEADKFVSLSADIKGTGKYMDSVVSEDITAAANAASISLAANGVEGSTAQDRLDNVQRIQAETSSGVWEEVLFSAVSDASPAVIVITAPGSTSDDITYRVLYRKTAAAWETFPARVKENPLRVSEATLIWGGKWNGSAFQGGRTMDAEIKSLEWELSNNLEIEFTFGAGGAYASRAFRPGRQQVIKIDRDMRDFLVQQHISSNDQFGLRILCQGPEYESGHNYSVELIWPAVAILSAPISVDGKRLAESGDLVVLDDGTYSSVIARVKNLQSGYAG